MASNGSTASRRAAIVRVRHEKFGMHEQPVTIEAGGIVCFDFTYPAPVPGPGLGALSRRGIDGPAPHIA